MKTRGARPDDGGSAATMSRPGAATAGVLMVGGGRRPFAGGLYARLSAELPALGVAPLQVQPDRPGDLDAATEQVLAGMEDLARGGVERVALLGHAFGAAVAIRAAVRDPRATAVCTLAAHSCGASEAALLAPRALLAIHGTHDPLAAASCSGDIVRMAGENARLELIDGAGNDFEAQAEAVHGLVHRWLRAQLT